ncbi:MAG: glutamine--fructose-6-phosphate transaminase (isomerizing) [Spirochaetaceae bacterium]|jgi:glucosamine--fructose-6-phosphate aminotransferase (isomerizing)|nr:glutamine--fructose-6-phosphate transaminase (isomerizing) [Spirochaetaceae bacterium]
MCGITGYIGRQDAAPYLLGALKKLEYRGYDSSGLALLHDGELIVRKAKGRISVLEERLMSEQLPFMANIGIAHTRWATHGEPSDLNSHPHTDSEGRIAVVHNGIIENYLDLKKWLQARDVVFASDTDTEVIAHLLNYYYKAREGKFFEAVLDALARLEGSYAIAILCTDYPDRIIAARKDSPLIIGLGEGENFLASDAPAFIQYTREALFLNDGELVVLYNDHVDLFTNTGEKLLRDTTHIEWDAESAEKGGYPHFMLKEIHEQPKALNDTYKKFDEIKLNDWLKGDGSPIERIIITACGTAWHAAMVGKRAFEALARIPVDVEIASEFRYGNPVIKSGDRVIVISQSGETADTLAAMRLAKEKQLPILAITNVLGSTLAREAISNGGSVIYTLAGPEIAVASTKAFTTQLMCLYLLAIKLGVLNKTISDSDYSTYRNELAQIPEKAALLLKQQEVIQKFAALQFNKDKVFFMGRQFDYAVSLEAALKLKEISYTHSESFAAGELKHGPIALVDTRTLVVAIATQRPLFEKLVSNIKEVAARGAATLLITFANKGKTNYDEVADSVFIIPDTIDTFSPMLSIIPAQLFAYYCSIQKGNDPDKPRNLAKSVTVE